MIALAKFFESYPTAWVMRNIAWQGWHLIALTAEWIRIGRVRISMRGTGMWVTPCR